MYVLFFISLLKCHLHATMKKIFEINIITALDFFLNM